MDKNVIKIINYPIAPAVNYGEILRYLKIGRNDFSLNDAVHSVVDFVLPDIEYKVCYEYVDISFKGNVIDFGSFTVESLDLLKCLSGCSGAVIFCATVGMGIDRAILKYSKTEMSKSVILQAAGSERTESLCDLFCDDLSRQFSETGFKLKPRFSPGFGDLPLTVQKDIFSLLKPEKNIGVTLNSSLLMSPSKSVTAIIGVYEDSIE